MNDQTRIAGELPTQRLIRWIERVETVLCTVSVVSFTLLVATNVVLRYVFGRPLYYAEEVSVILMIWMSLLAASLALGRQEMVAVTVFSDMAPTRYRHWLQVSTHLIVLGVSLAFAWASLVWMQSPSASRDMIVTLGIAKWYPYLIVPVFFVLVSLKSFNTFIITLRKRQT